jgi:hypothetical protein
MDKKHCRRSNMNRAKNNICMKLSFQPITSLHVPSQMLITISLVLNEVRGGLERFDHVCLYPFINTILAIEMETSMPSQKLMNALEFQSPDFLS